MGWFLMKRVNQLRNEYKVIKKRYKEIKHHYHIIDCYTDSKTRNRCMSDLKESTLKFITYLENYRTISIKSEAKNNCYNFLRVLYEEVNYDNSINEFCEFFESKDFEIVDNDLIYLSFKERVLACKTLTISYCNVKQIAKLDEKLYNLQKELIELIDLME